MKVTKEETSPREVVLNVNLESADVEPYLDKAYKRVVNRVQVPGFRPGKAPRILLENYVGRESLVRESLDNIVQESLLQAIKEENLDSFGEPDVEVLDVDPPSFKAVVPLEPTVDLGSFRDIHLEPESVEVKEGEVDRVTERMRYDAAPWEPVKRPVKFGDQVTLDVDGSVEGMRVADDRGVEFVPTQDNPSPFPGFSVYLEGLEKDESKEFTLPVPEDYQDNNLAGKKCRFKVKVLEIKEKVLADLDDEFAKGVGQGYENLEALRSAILKDLTEHIEREAQHAFQGKSLEEVIKGASVEVSQLTTKREIDHLLEDRSRALKEHRMEMDAYLQQVGKTMEELREELRPAAEERLNRYLVIRRLAQEEGIEVTPQEIDGEVETLTAGPGESNEKLRQAFSSEDARSSLGDAILTRKVLERLALIVQGLKDEEETSQEEQAPEAREETEDGDLALSGDSDEGQTPAEGGSKSGDGSQ